MFGVCMGGTALPKTINPKDQRRIHDRVSLQ